MLGWTCQLLAVYTAMRAFDIHEPLPAAGLVLVLMNVATIFPLWPGNVGLVQAAVALPLVAYYGVPKANGIAFGIGLQAIEASVGIGVGLHLPRARGALVRDAQGDAGRGAGRRPGARRRRAPRRAEAMPSARALACPASLKGVLSAREAAAALAEGLRTWAEVDELPVADGGEGTLDVLHSALGGDWREAEVSDAFGRPRDRALARSG